MHKVLHKVLLPHQPYTIMRSDSNIDKLYTKKKKKKKKSIHKACWSRLETAIVESIINL